MDKMDGIQEKKMNGWLALSPLVVFLLVYLVSSLIANDFYKVPVTSAFLIASIYAVAMTRGKIKDNVEIFSKGAGASSVMLMIWIFALAGAFASTAKAIGSIEATVNLTLMVLPGKLILAGLFVAACFISMAIGTSVGTIVALVPIAAGVASQTGIGIPLVTAIIVGGAFFGDNLSFISDTTIAATQSQGCSMADKFKTNIWIAAPAALIVTIIYVLMGLDFSSTPEVGRVNPLLLLPYVAIIVLAICGMNVLAALTVGLGINAVLGFANGSFGWIGFLSECGNGIAEMASLIFVTMLAGGMLEIIRHNGGLDFIIRGLTKRIPGPRGAEFCIAGLVSLANLCTANNTIAIITTGGIAKNITDKFGLDPRRSASILDVFSCIVQGIIPYGAQMLMASGLAGIPAFQIIGYLYYPFVLFGTACLAIIFKFPRRFAARRRPVTSAEQ
jgi:Na+/H+ antiporter NhaC